MNDGHRQRFGGAFGVSVAAHVVVAVALLTAPVRPIGRAPTVPAELTIEIEALPEPAPAAVVAPPPPTSPPLPAPTPPPSVVPRPSPRGTLTPTGPAMVEAVRVEPSVAVVEPVVPSVAPTVAERPETPEERRARLAVLLDPSRVARSSFQVEAGSGPSQRQGPQGAERFAAPGIDARAIERDLSEWMRSQATAKAYLARTRPQLRRQRDGTAVYAGHAFTATIREDGSVAFSDRPGVQTEGFSTSGSFDLGDVFMRASGQDPYAAEREWFLEQTEAERGRLEDAWRASHAESAVAGIPAHCERIWARAEQPAARRRRLIFELWDEAEGGDRASDARRAIERWVRERLPRGGEDAYPDEELARLNAGRAGAAPFAPYR